MNVIIKEFFMNPLKISVAAVCVFIFTVSGCGSSKMSEPEYSDSISCENREIVKILNDEPAIVRKSCFEHLGRVEEFYFELVNQHTEFFSLAGLIPEKMIPQQYRKEGLSVYISGNVTNCNVLAGCSEPNIKLPFMPVFELKSIKNNK